MPRNPFFIYINRRFFDVSCGVLGLSARKAQFAQVEMIQNTHQKPNVGGVARLSVAPMMDWTDRFCRYFHRQFSTQTRLYTEMITTHALIHGDRARLLKFHPAEHPLALQIGGSDRFDVAEATKIGIDAGFDEINLNCGCPSDRVQSGQFGAALMANPEEVGRLVDAMKAVSGDTPITVKCRLGIDDQVVEESLPQFLDCIIGAGVDEVIIHARKAWLKGLSPKENRDVPPLDYAFAGQMRERFPKTPFSINGGISDLKAARQFLADGFSGVMIGRAAYDHPARILGLADPEIFEKGEMISDEVAITRMLPFIDQALSEGARLHQITRHMLGAFSGRPGARAWRRYLSEHAQNPGAGRDVVEAALDIRAAYEEAA